jgi:hypothetical protein
LLYSDEGNDPQSAANYKKWPGLVEVVNQESRVTLVWCNGNEDCFYQGDTAALNQAIREFAKVDLKEHRVVILPQSKAKNQPYTWRLHIVNGIAASRFTDVPNQNEFYDVEPALYVYAGKNIQLNQLIIPDGMNVLGEDDLRTRYRKVIETASPRVLEFTLPMLASLNVHHLEDAQMIAKFLNDKNERISSSALRSIKQYGSEAKPLISELQAYSDKHPQNAAAIKELIDQFSSTEQLSEADAQYQIRHREIQKFLKTL